MSKTISDRGGVLPMEISRRTLLQSALAAGTVLGLSSTLAACSSSKSKGGGKNLLFLEPGDQPPRWNEVHAAVNKKLETDTGLTFDVQWIGWTNYAQSELLKYTSGAKFAGSLEADWLHINKLSQDKAIVALDDELTAAKYPNLMKGLDPLTIKTAKIGGKLYGVPQVNNATVILAFTLRSDLASGPVETFDDFEKYLYDVKQKHSSMIPYGIDNGYVNDTQDMFNPATWNSRPDYMSVRISSGYPLLFIKNSDAVAGNAKVVPVWEVPETIDTFRRIRKYYNDGIINHDALSVDNATAISLFGAGKYAAEVGSTNGLQTTTYGGVTTKVKGAQIELCVPFAAGAPKPYSAFGAGNQMSFNVRGGQAKDGLRFEDWLSIKENHDLLQYGIEGTDWKASGDHEYEVTSKYNFPGYTMSWRVPLERTPTNMVESERKWFGWSQKFDSFELSPLAGYVTDATPIKTQVAQMDANNTRYLKPLQAGAIDTDKGLNAAKKGFSSAGLDKVIAEVEKQLTAFFKTRG